MPEPKSETGDPRFDAERFIAQLTQRPGVYQMLDEAGDTLYVGKAKNLRSRVSSYFRAAGLNAKTMAMVARIRDIRITITASDTEALLLEQSLIKAMRPHYNIVLRDDKSYPYIYLTGHDDYPRLTFHRGAKQRQGKYFGPYPSAYAVRDTLNMLQKLFLTRQCDDSFFKHRSRPCLQYQIKRCSGPCVGLITPDDYRADVTRAVKFLEGRSNEVLAEYQQAMEHAASALEYEKAARHRDQIAHLRRVQDSQNVHGEQGDADIIAAVQAPGGLCIQIQFLRQGRMLGHRNWFPHDQLDSPLDEALNAFVTQFYVGAEHGGFEIPKEIILNQPIADAELLSAALSAQSGRKVTFAFRVRGHRARWVALAVASAEQALGTHLLDRGNVYSRFEALQEALHAEAMPERLCGGPDGST